MPQSSIITYGTKKASKSFLCLRQHTYSSGQNKVPIAERLYSDYSATISDFTTKSFRKVTSIIAQPENFSTSTLFYFRARTCNNKNWDSPRTPTPPHHSTEQLPTRFIFIFYLLVVGKSSTEELKLYNPLKHSLVLSIGYSYSAQFIGYLVC